MLTARERQHIKSGKAFDRWMARLEAAGYVFLFIWVVVPTWVVTIYLTIDALA